MILPRDEAAFIEKGILGEPAMQWLLTRLISYWSPRKLMMETDTDSTIFSVASIEILISIKVTLPVAKELL